MVSHSIQVPQEHWFSAIHRRCRIICRITSGSCRVHFGIRRQYADSWTRRVSYCKHRGNFGSRFDVRVEPKINKPLGMSIRQEVYSLTIYNYAIVEHLLASFGMSNCKEANTPFPHGTILPHVRSTVWHLKRNLLFHLST